MRGRNNGYDDAGNLAYSGGAPWGVTDLKAAIRYYRYNADQLPGDTERIFTFGMSGGGAQSAVAGASGDSELYNPYLMEIGAAMKDNDGNYISDAVCGSMCWCPITSLDYADEAYEWNLGQYASEGTRADGTFTAALSDDMSIKYAEYINQLGLKDKDGNALTLEESETGIYTTGSYYDYLLSVVETSLNYFLSDTTFPYTATAGFTRPDGGFAGGDGQTPPEGIGQEGGNSSNSASELSNWDASYVESYSNGISTTDSLGNSSSYRQNMYNPMYYLSEYYEGYGTSKLAQNWRIYTGIEQGDTALTVETNLALALEQCDDVKSVEFETVWNQGHTTAERTGDSTTNFIAWVNECVK